MANPLGLSQYGSVGSPVLNQSNQDKNIDDCCVGPKATMAGGALSVNRVSAAKMVGSQSGMAPGAGKGGKEGCC